MKQRSFGTMATLSLAAGLAAGLAATTAGAAPLAPGDTIFVTGSTLASHPDLDGVVQQDAILTTNAIQIPPGANPLINFADFEVRHRVTQSDADATMIFGPRILFGRNVTPFPLLVHRVEMSGFGAVAIDATYRTDDVGDRGPTFASRSGDGQTLTFDFGFPLFVSNLVQEPQEESHFFSLETDAMAFENTGRLSIFAEALGDPVPGREYRFDVGGLAVPTDIPPVPLPASLPLLVIAACGLACLRRRRGT